MDQQRYDEFSGTGEGAAQEPHFGPRSKPDGSIDPAGEAGWYLEHEREARGISIEAAAAATGIHPYHIQAIEYGDMTHMPPRLEALEMIAAYANSLGFDPDPLLEHYITFLPPPEMAPRHHPANPAPLSSAKIMLFGRFPKIPPLNIRLPSMPQSRNGIVASCAAVFLLFTGTVWSLSSGSDPAPATIMAESNNTPDPMPTATTGQESAEVRVTETPLGGEALAGLEEGPVAAPEDEETDQGDDLGAFITQQVEGASDPVTVASTAPAPKNFVEETPNGRIFGSNDAKSRVMLKATRSIWLLIEDGHGNRVATQLLNQGDMFRVPSTPGLVAIAQDGGAIKYLIDGKERGLLGMPGTLLAAEPLDVKKLEAKG